MKGLRKHDAEKSGKLWGINFQERILLLQKSNIFYEIIVKFERNLDNFEQIY